jgi:predicted Zn-dependent peptidase
METQLVEFDNGLRTFTVYTPTFKSIIVQVSLKGGSMHEESKENGISHFVEHMALQGSKSFPDRYAFDEQIELLGGSYNGYTSQYTVAFKISVPDNQLDFALDFIRDIITNALFQKESYITEKAAILDEIYNMDTDPYTKYQKFWNKNRYKKGSIPFEIGGTRSRVERMSLGKILDWYKELMQPENMLISIVGNVENDIAIQKVREKFSDLKNESRLIGSRKPHKIEYAPGVIKTQVDSSEKKSIGAISIPSLSLMHNSYQERQAANILEAVIANYRSSILYKKLRKELGMIYHIYADLSFHIESDGVFEIIFTTSDDQISEVYKIVLEELQKLRENGIDEKLFKLGLESGNNALKMGFTSMGQVVGWYSSAVYWFNEVTHLEEAIEKRNEIDLDLANEVLKKLLDKEQMSIISRVNSEKTKTKLEKSLLV